MNQESHKSITTISAPAPVGPYNQGILAGNWLFCSGQIALDPISNEMIKGGDVQKEARQVLNNLNAVLKEAGTDSSKIVRTTIYLVDLKDFQKVNEIYADFFKTGINPARACVQVSALPKGALVEIDCIAWVI